MKTYTKYTEITPKEALMALAENDGKPVGGFAVYTVKGWVSCPIYGVQHSNGQPFMAKPFECSQWGDSWDKCARIEEINPRDVPEGVTPLPSDKPWLAYVPDSPEFPHADTTHAYFCKRRNDWIANVTGGCAEFEYAIDVRTAYAKEHFPQIVQAMEYTEYTPFEQWYSKNHGYTQGVVKSAFEKCWNAAIESQSSKAKSNNQ